MYDALKSWIYIYTYFYQNMYACKIVLVSSSF